MHLAFLAAADKLRRHYARQDSPLTGALDRYQDLSALLGDFRHYLEFFLLDDHIDKASVQVSAYLPFDSFPDRRCRGPLLNTRPTGRPHCTSFVPGTSESRLGRRATSPEADMRLFAAKGHGMNLQYMITTGYDALKTSSMCHSKNS